MTQHATELTKDSRRDSLAPVPDSQRIFGLGTYITMWISSMVVIQLFIIGQSFLPPNGSLNIFQAVLVTVISSVIIAFMFVYNSHPGIAYGIPFIVQARTAFGTHGARLASLIRVIPAIFWYGIGSWIGASAIDYITQTIWGWGSVWSFFILFQVLQTIIAFYGIKSIKWFDSILSFAILGFLAYIIVQLFKVGGGKMLAGWQTGGDWGLPFYTAITASVGILITGAINNADLSRYLKNEAKANWIGHFVGIVPMFIIMLLTGILSAAATGIWDPIQALVAVIPNPAVAIAMMIFIVVAQFTSNLTLNIEPPAIVLMETFDMKWGVAVIVVGVLSIVTFPWLLLTSAAFNSFIAVYSAFLGPLLGILLADFYFVRKKRFDLEQLYGSSVKYNWIGLGSLVAGGILGVIFLPVSWMVSLPVSAVLYGVAQTRYLRYAGGAAQRVGS